MNYAALRRGEVIFVPSDSDAKVSGGCGRCFKVLVSHPVERQRERADSRERGKESREGNQRLTRNDLFLDQNSICYTSFVLEMLWLDDYLRMESWTPWIY